MKKEHLQSMITLKSEPASLHLYFFIWAIWAILIFKAIHLHYKNLLYF